MTQTMLPRLVGKGHEILWWALRFGALLCEHELSAQLRTIRENRMADALEAVTKGDLDLPPADDIEGDGQFRAKQ